MQLQTYRIHNFLMGIFASVYVWLYAPSAFRYGHFAVPVIGYVCVVIASIIVSTFARTVQDQRALSISNRFGVFYHCVFALCVVHLAFIRPFFGVFAPIGPILITLLFITTYAAGCAVCGYAGYITQPRGVCLKCGYPLPAQGRCPECGCAQIS
jgi:hypothetical protein